MGALSGTVVGVYGYTQWCSGGYSDVQWCSGATRYPEGGTVPITGTYTHYPGTRVPHHHSVPARVPPSVPVLAPSRHRDCQFSLKR